MKQGIILPKSHDLGKCSFGDVQLASQGYLNSQIINFLPQLFATILLLVEK
jgi:hypothetical protein